ncbi:MAG TPA: VWA domain-containing protein, partial [Enorma massiliensis]|uniref:VWA domain-containing protein n=1 Tax=Enorma massiliensis TaxID=1472761 RepID=UPI001D8BCEF1
MFVATVTSYALGYDPVGAISGALGISPRSAATTTGVWEADTSTQNSWYEGDLGVSGQGNNSTQNTGRIWTDKSVYSGDATLTNASSGETTFTVENDEGTALVELSALSSAARISGVTTASQPLDIVLVLDASGSMDNTQDNNPYLDSYAEAYDVRNNNGQTYYVLVDGEYQRVFYQRSRWYYMSGRYPEYVTPMTSADDTTSGHVQFYTRMTKMDALQQAADNFIAQTAAENAQITDSTQRHRIALVKFASTYTNNVGNGTDGDGYNNSQIMSGFQYVNGNTSQTLQNTVNSLDGNGATRADYGLTHANRLMNGEANGGYGSGARSYAQRVVIFFTDGNPTSYSSFNDDVAGSAINQAKELKDNGALVFSIGVFDGATPSDTNGNFNRYMNAVSSNYPSAECYETDWWGNYDRQVDDFEYLHLGDSSDEDYYYAAEDAESLNSVFEAIYDRVTEGVATPPIANDGETTIGGQPVGYLTFTDQLGDYTEVKNFKRVIYAGHEFTLNEDTPTSIDEETGDTLYRFAGEVTANDIYGESNLADLIVRVHHENGRAGDTVTVEIPSSLLPLRLYTAGPNDEDGIDNDVKDAYPIRIFYTVGLKDGLVDNNGTLDTSQIDSSYITSHTDANGNLVFHSNSYAGRNNSATTAGGAGTTTATFTPATTNAFYYFTSDTPIYNTQNTNNPAGTLQPGSQYWYMRTYYSGGEEQQEWVQFTYDDNRLSEYVSTDENDHAYIESGAPRFTRANEFVAAKADGANVTDTAENSISPDWSGSGEVTVTLGNNGRIAYPMKGDLRIDKDVNWGDGTENPDKEFTYTVNFNGDETITGEFDYTKYTEDGTTIDNNGDELGEGQTTGTLADGG